MANRKISELAPLAVDLTGDEILPVVQDGVTKRPTINQTLTIPGTGGRLDRNLKDKAGDVVSVKDFGAVGDGVTDDTAAFNSACDYVGGLGGGTVEVPIGNYKISNTNASANNWDNHRCIWLRYDNIRLVGKGRGSKLTLAAGANAHAVKIGQRVDGTVTVHGCEVRNLEIDGNRANQTPPSESVDHWNGVDVATGCIGAVLSDLYVHDCQYYGIGVERGGYKDCIVQNILIEDTGADGIDWKDDDQNSTGNVLRGITVRRFGLVGTLSLPQAGVDMRTGVDASDIVVEDFGTAQGLIGIRFQQGANAASSTTMPLQPSSLSGFSVRAATKTGTTGVRTIAPSARVSNGWASNCDNGLELSYREPQVENVTLYDNTADMRLRDSGGTAVSNGMFVGVTCRGVAAAGTGVVVDTGCIGNTFTNCTVRGHALGYDLRAGSSSTKILGGSAAANTTAVTDAATSTTIRDVEGCRTQQTVTVTNVDIASTGTKTITFNHTLAFTPDPSDIELTLIRNTNVGDWSWGFLWITATTSTTVTAQLRVLTASATVGAVVTARANMVIKKG